jgi:hypothetical protein
MNVNIYNRLPYMILGAFFGYKICAAHCESQKMCQYTNNSLCFLSTYFNINIGLITGIILGDFYAKRIAIIRK